VEVRWILEMLKRVFSRKREAKMEVEHIMLIRDVVQHKQPETFRKLEQHYGPFLGFEEYRRMMEEKPRERVGRS